MLRKPEAALWKSSGFQFLRHITGITTKRYLLSTTKVPILYSFSAQQVCLAASNPDTQQQNTGAVI